VTVKLELTKRITHPALLIISLEIFQAGMILLPANICLYAASIYKLSILLRKRHLDRQMDRVIPMYGSFISIGSFAKEKTFGQTDGQGGSDVWQFH